MQKRKHVLGTMRCALGHIQWFCAVWETDCMQVQIVVEATHFSQSAWQRCDQLVPINGTHQISLKTLTAFSIFGIKGSRETYLVLLFALCHLK